MKVQSKVRTTLISCILILKSDDSFRVDKNEDLKYLERGILVEEFDNMKEKRKYDMEFRVL